MEKGNKIISVYLNYSDDLGLKIIFVTSKLNKSYYAVITEVNPHSVCHKENISVGDVLLSFGGINIDSYETLKQLSANKSENYKTNQFIELKIKKREAFEIDGLYHACLNIPCSEVCKIIVDWKPKVIPRKSIDNKTDIPRKIYGKQTDSKGYRSDLSTLTKSTNFGSLEDSGKQSVDVKYKMQKAVPMKKKETENRSYRATLRPKKSFKSHVISPAQPTFINRKPNQNIDQVTNLKESRSMSNLSNITKNHSKQNSQSSSSWDSSGHSSDELTNKFVPKTKLQIDNNSTENPVVFRNDTKELEKSKRLSKSMDLMVLELKTTSIFAKTNKEL